MPGVTWSSFPLSGQVYDSGDILFNAPVRRGQGTVTGLFRATPDGSFQRLVLSDQPAPGTSPGVMFGAAYPGGVNSAGDVLFSSNLVGPGIEGDDDPNYHATWLLSGGRLQLVARDGDLAPGTSAAFRVTSVQRGLSEAGNVLMWGELLPDFRSGLWYGRPGVNLRPVLLEGQPVAGLPGFSVGDIGRVNRSGGEPTVVHAALAAPEWKSDGHNSDAVFSGRPDDLRLVAHVGAPAPGTGSTFRTLGGVTNSHGEIALSSRLADGSYAVFVGSPSDVRPVLRTGDEAPGTGAPFHSFLGAGHLTDGGILGVGGHVRVGPEVRHGLWAGPPDALRLVALNGQQAPGTVDGTFIRLINNTKMNDNGLVVFHSPLEGPGARGHDDYGIFATDPSGRLHLIARKGELFEVAQGDVRTIAGQTLMETAYVTSFNDANTFPLTLRFTDGSEGLFTFRILPEPSSLLLMLGALVAAIARRRRSHPV
jgi:hypothetical protein